MSTCSSSSRFKLALIQYSGDNKNLQDVKLERTVRRRSSLGITRGEQLLESYCDMSFAFEIPARAARPLSTPILDGDDTPRLAEHREGPPVKEGQTILTRSGKVRRQKLRGLKVSRHAIPYRSLPTGIIRNLIPILGRQPGNKKDKISKDSLGAIIEATDWFFEQLSEDLTTFAKHGGRKTIDESDMITLMKRCSTSVQNGVPSSRSHWC